MSKISYFGKNIRKIRSLKSLSQQEFGEIFDIKRATLGAYEEERSEPKIETIIRIANHFSIPIDDLLTRELTVNQIANFKDDFALSPGKVVSHQFQTVPCITEAMQIDYINKFSDSNFIKELPELHLPINPDKTFRGLTVTNLEMSRHDKGFYPRDVVIGEIVPANVYKKLTNGTLVFVITDSEIIFRKLYSIKNEFILRADHKGIPDIKLEQKLIKEMWRVRYAFFRRIPEFGEELEEKLNVIENQIRDIKDSLDV